MSEARARFEALCDPSETEFPLDQACAWIAAEDNPEVDAEDLIVRLDVLAEGLWIPEGVSVAEKVARLNHHLFHTLGFDGDREDYGEPKNSLLDQVLERRRGLPILLCAVAMEVGRRAGLALEGVGFPGHFLVSPMASDPRFFVDPFNGGRILVRDALIEKLEAMASQAGGRLGDPEPFLRAVPNRYVVLRMCNNLKGAYLRADDVGGALRAVERLLLIDDNLHEERRDRGMMLHHLGRDVEAVHELRTYLARWPGAPDRKRVETLIEQLS